MSYPCICTKLVPPEYFTSDFLSDVISNQKEHGSIRNQSRPPSWSHPEPIVRKKSSSWLCSDLSRRARYKGSQISSSEVGMGFSVNGLIPETSGNYITIRDAAEIGGYNQQYQRRLLRRGIFRTRKIGQIRLINKVDFNDYLEDAINSEDNRFGPQI